MSQQEDTPRLDRQAERMEDQERRLENDQPPSSLNSMPARSVPPTAQPATPSLDVQEDRMEDQERRLENGQPPRNVGNP
jgi:hypothetical protein